MPLSKSDLVTLSLLQEPFRAQAEMLLGKGCVLRRVDHGLELVSESGAVIAKFDADCQADAQAGCADWEGEDLPLIMTKKRQARSCHFCFGLWLASDTRFAGECR